MRFSVFLNARSMSPEQDRGLIQDLIAHVDLADELGFDAIFLPDHHFTGYMPIASDPFLFAAFLAATHKRMHFGFSVTSVPLHSPIRFVERINILDQLTDGKILVGIGSGTTPEEMIGFGVNYKEASQVAEENLAIAEQLWAKTMTSEPVKFDTGHYKGEVLQRIAPAPFTPGHGRLMPVAMKEASARRAGENGWPAFIPAFTPPQIGGLDPLSHVKKHFDKYRTLLLAAGHSKERVADALSWTTHTYQCVHVAPTDEQAREELMIILRAYQAAIEREAIFNTRAEQSMENKKKDQTPDALTSSRPIMRTECRPRFLWASISCGLTQEQVAGSPCRWIIGPFNTGMREALSGYSRAVVAACRSAVLFLAFDSVSRRPLFYLSFFRDREYPHDPFFERLFEACGRE